MYNDDKFAKFVDILSSIWHKLAYRCVKQPATDRIIQELRAEVIAEVSRIYEGPYWPIRVYVDENRVLQIQIYDKSEPIFRN